MRELQERLFCDHRITTIDYMLKLFLGTCCKFSRKNDISVVLNVGCGIENKFSDLIEYHNIELLDIPEQKINTGKERL